MNENVNPLSLMRAFGQWCEQNYLPPMAELLWYKLFQFFNRLGWPEWVQIDLSRLAAMIGGDRKQTAIGLRDMLLNHGLIGYRRGSKGDPSKYSILRGEYFSTKCGTPSVPNPVPESVPNPVPESVPNPVPESATIYRYRQDIDKDKEKNGVTPLPPSGGSDTARKRFTPPTVEDVRAYCQERQNKVDPERFCDFYASKGWKVGSAGMKDWRACVRTWERREERQAGTAAPPPRGKTVIEQQYSQRHYDPAEYDGPSAREIEEARQF